MANYNILPTVKALDGSELYIGRTVCFKDVVSDTNNIGILEKAYPNERNAVWAVNINNIRYTYTADNYKLPKGRSGYDSTDVTYRLYGIETSNDLIIEDTNKVTRGDKDVTLSTLNVKDNFAIAAMQGIISNIPNPLSMDNATIMTIAVKSYKIAEAMCNVGAYARTEDSSSSTDNPDNEPVDVDKNNLSDNIETLLYNIWQALLADTKHTKENGIVIRTTEEKDGIVIKTTEDEEGVAIKTDKPMEINSTIQGTPTVKIDGTPTVKIDGTAEVEVTNTAKVNISNVPSVTCTNMISTPVRVTGTVNIGNFPETSE